MQKTNKPLISVIVPVYNVKDYLVKCIESILGQSYSNLQLILVDDGSSDGSGKICDSYQKKDERVVVVHQLNKGVSAARNCGIEVSKGEYIGFVDSDDWIHRDMFSRLYELISEYEADISCIGLFRTSDENYVFPNKEMVETYDKREYLKKFFKIGSQEIIYHVYNKLYKKQVIPRNPFPVEYAIGEDVIFIFKIALNAKKIVCSDRILYCYRQGVGVTSRFNKKYFDLVKVWNDIIEIANETHEREILKWSIINRDRINFTILSELATSGEYVKYKKESDYLIQELKKKKRSLLGSPISISRKILIILYCWNYALCSRVVYAFVKKRQ